MTRSARPLRRGVAPATRRVMSDRAIDPKTGLLRRGRVERQPFMVALHLPKRLESPSRWLWASWMVKKRAVDAWKSVIRQAALDTRGTDVSAVVRVSPAAGVGWTAPPMRVRVDVLRLVRQRNHFIADRDNRMFAAKAVVDCVVKAGFLRDDSEAHIDLHVDQAVSPDGLDWTVVTITAPAGTGTEHLR